MKLRTAGTLAAMTALAFSACNQTPGSSAGATGGTGAKPAACENKKGTSSTEIHVYSSLPRQGTNTEQTNTLVEQIRTTLEARRSATSRSPTPTSTTRRPPRTATGTVPSRSPTPTRPRPIPTR